MTTDSKKHWEEVYSENGPDEVSWYQTAHETSLQLIKRAGADKKDWIIDVGAGASSLVDRLLEQGYEKIALLDVSENGLSHSKKRLGEKAHQLEWLVADITQFKPKHSFAVWHDRAVFHFLIDPQARLKYVEALKSALVTGGHAMIATFAIGGPIKCSGLDILQYDPEKLSKELGTSFQLVETVAETHRTPWDSEQKFIYCLFRRAF